MNLAHARALPPTLTTEEAANLLGVSTDHLWKLRREGNAPVEPLELGRALRWPTAKLLDLLGLSHSDGRPQSDLDELGRGG